MGINEYSLLVTVGCWVIPTPSYCVFSSKTSGAFRLHYTSCMFWYQVQKPESTCQCFMQHCFCAEFGGSLWVQPPLIPADNCPFSQFLLKAVVLMVLDSCTLPFSHFGFRIVDFVVVRWQCQVVFTKKHQNTHKIFNNATLQDEGTSSGRPRDFWTHLCFTGSSERSKPDPFVVLSHLYFVRCEQWQTGQSLLCNTPWNFDKTEVMETKRITLSLLFQGSVNNYPHTRSKNKPTSKSDSQSCDGGVISSLFT